MHFIFIEYILTITAGSSACILLSMFNVIANRYFSIYKSLHDWLKNIMWVVRHVKSGSERFFFFLQIAIILTNQVQCELVFMTTLYILILYPADPGATLSFAPGGAMKPIGGHILSHASATRMALRKGLSHSVTHQ